MAVKYDALDTIKLLDTIGFFDVIVPFILAVIITYMFLDITYPSLEQKVKRVIAFAVGFIFVSSKSLVLRLFNIGPKIIYLLVVLFFGIVILEISKVYQTMQKIDVDDKWKEIFEWVKLGFITIIALVIFAIFFIGGGEQTSFKIDENILAFLAVLLPIGVMVGILYIATK
ncbi:NEQ250 [Nanoarchaeum equitans Kin4-M]|uniref:NEQ250 n=1 Tax=Nanoarchaeum equitans (strain Kin4-M) TaxID=228908 RepID=Q74NF4_NANEQ|nr:NEQ250 [Nanoarchaeum equitans Kin4-M]